MGIVYFIAFVSLWVQIDGLIGSKASSPRRNIWNLSATGRRAHIVWDAASLLSFPFVGSAQATVFYLLCGAGGTALSLLVILGIATAPSLALLWLFYLSLCVVGEPFLNFQWDALLLETGFLATFFAPRRLLPGLTREAHHQRTALWLRAGCSFG